jgi:uncharacterized protein YjiS (DUF1127 family)
MRPDKYFLSDPTRLPELALASDCAAPDRSAARPDAAMVGPRAGRTAAPAQPASRVRALLARIAAWLFVALQRSRQRRALSALSDNLLQDMGLTRDEFMDRTSNRWP